MTIATESSGGIWIFLHELSRQSRGPISRPRCFERGMFCRFGRGLCGVMTFNTDHLRAFNATILRGMVQVAELHWAKFGLRRQHDYFRRLFSVLDRNAKR